MIEVRRTIQLRAECTQRIRADSIYDIVYGVTEDEVVDVRLDDNTAEIIVHCFDDEYSGKNPVEEYEQEIINGLEKAGYTVVR
jgi:hypothetical protein